MNPAWAAAITAAAAGVATAALLIVLPLLLDRYNFTRPHGSLGHRGPATRVKDLVGSYS